MKPRRAPVTIHDIARRVGKSVATVSRALNDYVDVSPQTKDLVRRTAVEMGYRPNTLAQRFKKMQSDTLGLLIPTYGPRFSEPFFSEFIAGVGNKGSELGFDLLVSTRSPGEDETQMYEDYVRDHRVDGFILTRTRRVDQRIDMLRAIDFPFVAFGRVEGELDFPFVDEDGRHGMGLIVNHLCRLGHRRIACITSPLELNFTGHRLEGFHAAIQENELELLSEHQLIGDLTQRSGYECAQQLLTGPHPPTAIVAFNDLMAVGAISAAQELGLTVGKDVSITGFDDLPMAEHTHPPLTTIRQPIYQIGGMVCEMLVKLIRVEPLAQEQIVLQPVLVQRQSCGPPGNAHYT